MKQQILYKSFKAQLCFSENSLFLFCLIFFLRFLFVFLLSSFFSFSLFKSVSSVFYKKRTPANKSLPNQEVPLPVMPCLSLGAPFHSHFSSVLPIIHFTQCSILVLFFCEEYNKFGGGGCSIYIKMKNRMEFKKFMPIENIPCK